jgi:c-di-GMP phosphodiesterase
VRLFALINHLAQDCDNVVIAEAARKDVALSYRLLRYANSPAVGLRHSVDSIEQALSLLGRNEFRRWLQVMLLTTGSSRPASLALQEDALARARLFEMLGRERGETTTDALFTLGLLSQLDLLLQVPLADALEPLRLPEDMRAALLDRRGSWSAYLTLADELEQDDESRLDQAAKAFGGAATVLAHAQSAWIWAARVMASQQTPAVAASTKQSVPA